jgi:hypothetical protein
LPGLRGVRILPWCLMRVRNDLRSGLSIVAASVPGFDHSDPRRFSLMRFSAQLATYDRFVFEGFCQPKKQRQKDSDSADEIRTLILQAPSVEDALDDIHSC